VSNSYRTFSATVLLMTFNKISLRVNSRRVRSVKSYWLVAGGLLLVLGSLRVIYYLGLFVYLQFNLSVLGLFFADQTVFTMITNIIILAIAIITFLVGILFPEVMLISTKEMVDSDKIYQMVQKFEASAEQSIFPEIVDPNKVILNYLEELQKLADEELDSIDDEVKDELDSIDDKVEDELHTLDDKVLENI